LHKVSVLKYDLQKYKFYSIFKISVSEQKGLKNQIFITVAATNGDKINTTSA